MLCCGCPPHLLRSPAAPAPAALVAAAGCDAELGLEAVVVVFVAVEVLVAALVAVVTDFVTVVTDFVTVGPVGPVALAASPSLSAVARVAQQLQRHSPVMESFLPQTTN